MNKRDFYLNQLCLVIMLSFLFIGCGTRENSVPKVKKVSSKMALVQTTMNQKKKLSDYNFFKGNYPI